MSILLLLVLVGLPFILFPKPFSIASSFFVIILVFIRFVISTVVVESDAYIFEIRSAAFFIEEFKSIFDMRII